MRILIDGRLYGLENAGLGRYLINLVNELGKLDAKNNYVLLLRKKYFDGLSLPSNWRKVLADFGHYGFCIRRSNLLFGRCLGFCLFSFFQFA